MRLHLRQIAMDVRPADLAGMSFEEFDEGVERDPSEFWERVAEPMFVHPYMSYYYGGLYVLIEGWRKLRLSDPTIDALLQSPHVDALKMYRNGSFHFHPDYFNNKFLALVAITDAPIWIQSVRDAFSAWFLKHFRALESKGGSS